jgi:hypothetical protein
MESEPDDGPTATFFDLLPLSSPVKPINFVTPKKVQDGHQQNFPEPNMDDIIKQCDEYYPLIVSHHAPRQVPMSCHKPNCGSTDPLYTCEQCFGDDWYCSTCLVERHLTCPFHNIFFHDREKQCKMPTELHKLGLVVSLSHRVGGPIFPSKNVTKRTEKSLLLLEIMKKLYYFTPICDIF